MGIDGLDTLVKTPTDQWFGKVVNIPLAVIQPDPENLREDFNENDLLDLGKNIKEIGQLDEISVFPVLNDDQAWTGFFDLHDGERRWRAAKLVGLPELRAKIVPRPSRDELLFKKLSRVLQTRSLSPEKKVGALEKVLKDLGVYDKPQEWEKYRDKLGGGSDWPQLIRVLLLKPQVRQFMQEGKLNFTLAQSIGRLPAERQIEAAEFVIVNKLNARFFSTEMVPYLLETPSASMVQAFEHARVSGWRQYTKSPYKKGQEPPTNELVESFLEACVKWERAWELVVHSGLVYKIQGSPELEARVRDGARRIGERAKALFEKVGRETTADVTNENVLKLPYSTEMKRLD